MTRYLLGLIVSAFLTSVASADEWGDLSMRFVYDGEPPQPQPIEHPTIRRCGDKQFFDESLLVDASDRGLANVLVWLLKDDAAVPVHSSLATAPPKVKIVSRECRFEPRIVVLHPSQTLLWSNEDSIVHGLRCDLARNRLFDTVLRGGGTWERQFQEAESQPAPVVSNIIPPMRAFLFVYDSPYAAVSDAHGRLTIGSLPAGRRTLVVWHEKMGLERTVIRSDNSIAWTGGRMVVEIKAGMNDLGEIKVSPEVLRR